MVASMIRAGLKTACTTSRSADSTRTRAEGGPNGRHSQLLQTGLAELHAFYADLKAGENDKRVLTMVFSEFGRRVGQNASGGTDHGTAAPMFLVGPMVRRGLIGEHPSMTDLDDGDLKYKIDFRSVYAGILRTGWAPDSRAILGGSTANSQSWPRSRRVSLGLSVP
ncbi:MAG: DUF1501 domain-containing protein [Phycisphaerales bacterium]|nr:DUF1501 domain-containing protein [Phycisphaerales bacterium]